MAGKAPLLLAAFFFGIGASGLFLLTTYDRAAWGPFRPQSAPAPPQRVIFIDVGTTFTPPPLDGLLTTSPPASAEAYVASPTNADPDAGAAADASVAAAAAPTAEPTPTPTPIPPVRIHGVAAENGASAAGGTPTPPPRIIIINVAVGDDTDDD
jgi:hypothetical protein